MRSPRLVLLLLVSFLIRLLRSVTLYQGLLGRFPASCQKLERTLESSTPSSVQLPELGQCQSAVLLGSSVGRTSGSWHHACLVWVSP